MTPQTRNQLLDLFEVLAALEIQILEGTLPEREIRIQLAKIRNELYRIMKEAK